MQEQIDKYVNIIFTILIAITILILISIYYFPSLSSKYFTLDQITINGSEKSNEIEIKELIFQSTKNLLSLDLYSIKETIEKEKWVKRVNLKKNYPSNLILNIVENNPYAIFRDQGKYYMLDIDGTIITKKTDEYKFDDFLIVTGSGSRHALEEIIKEININFSEIVSQIKELELIENRRWNLTLKNNLLIKLPDSGIEKALENLNNLFVEEKVLQSNIIEIDLRIDGRASLKVDEGKINFGINEI